MNRRSVLTSLPTVGAMALAGCSDAIQSFTGHDVEEVKSNAESIEYDDLYRNVSEYEGEPVTYSDVGITDVTESDEDSQKFILTLPSSNWGDSKHLYGLWEGKLFKENDTVRIWGVVDGVHTYMSLSGEQTVPQLDLVDIELQE